TRELRSHMETFHGIIGGPEIKHIEAELKLLASILGVARDAEVVEERWQSLLAAEDSDTLDDTTRGHIANDMGKEYARAHRKVVAALNSDRYLNLLDSLDELLADPPVSSPEGKFPEAVPAAYEPAADTDEPAEREADASTATEITTSDSNSSSNQVAEVSEEEEDAADAAGTDESDESEQPDEVDEAERARKSKKEEKAAAKRAAKKASKEMEQVLAG